MAAIVPAILVVRSKNAYTKCCAARCSRLSAGKMMRRRSRADKSLVCLLQGLTGLRVTVELRNETELRGKIQDVDALMKFSL